MGCPFYFTRFETSDIQIGLEYKDGTYEGILEGYREVKVTLSQIGTSLTKGTSELGIDVENSIINLYLSQEETGMFWIGPCEIQVNVYFENKERDVSSRGTIMVDKNLYNEVMTDE